MIDVCNSICKQLLCIYKPCQQHFIAYVRTRRYMNTTLEKVESITLIIPKILTGLSTETPELQNDLNYNLHGYFLDLPASTVNAEIKLKYYF